MRLSSAAPDESMVAFRSRISRPGSSQRARATAPARCTNGPIRQFAPDPVTARLMLTQGLNRRVRPERRAGINPGVVAGVEQVVTPIVHQSPQDAGPRNDPVDLGQLAARIGCC